MRNGLFILALQIIDIKLINKKYIFKNYEITCTLSLLIFLSYGFLPPARIAAVLLFCRGTYLFFIRLEAGTFRAQRFRANRFNDFLFVAIK
jgi:hypothetical protein